MNEKMEYTTVRNNKDTNGILKSAEKQEVTSGLLESKEREQSDIKNVQIGEEQMESQFFKEEKTENVNTSKKPHKELMEYKASEEELGKNQESNTVICGKESKICGKSEGK